MIRALRSIPIEVAAFCLVAAFVGGAVWYASRGEPPPSDSSAAAARDAGNGGRGRGTPRDQAAPDSSRTDVPRSASGAALGSLPPSSLTDATGETVSRAIAGGASGSPTSFSRDLPASATGTSSDAEAPLLRDATPLATPGPPLVRDGSAEATALPGALPTPTAAADGSIAGVVAGRITGRPVSGVNLLSFFQGVPWGTVVSDRGGSFLFEHLPPGPHRIETVGYSASADAEVLPGETSRVSLFIDDRGSISGSVLDPWGRTVRGASVVLLRGGLPPFGAREEDSQTTRDDGSFFFLSCPVGVPVEVRAAHEAYAPAAGGPFLLQPGFPLEGIELVLAHGAGVAGRVTTSQGAPIAQARLEARVMGQWGRPDSAERGGGASTGPDGSYRIANLPLGEWEVQATAAGYGLQRKRCALANPGEVLPLDFTLSPGDTLLGAVIDSGARPIDGAVVRLVGGLTSRETRTDRSGIFQFDSVPRGAYNVGAERSGYSPAWQSLDSAGGDQITLVLADPGELSVQVVDAENRPVDHFTLTLSRRDFPRSLLSQDPDRVIEVSSPAGSWSDTVGAGRFHLMVTAEGYRPAHRDAAVPPGASRSPVRIQMAGGMTLPGRVVALPGAAPVPEAQLAWFYGHIPDPGPGFSIPDPALLANPVGAAVSDPAGRFLLDGLPPANITVLCRAPGFAPWLSQGLSMRLPPGELLIELETGVRVHGSVRYAGLPFPYASVQLEPEGALRQIPPEWRTTTDGRGEFCIDLVRPGAYRLYVTRPYDGSVLARTFHLEVPGEDARFDVVFPSGELSVSLTDAAAGVAIPHGPVRLRCERFDDLSAGIRLEMPPTLTLNYPDGDGAFTFVALPEGEYRLEAAPRGYQPAERPLTHPGEGRLFESFLLEPAAAQ